MPIKQHNHVYLLVAGDSKLFLKTYTKSWYGDDVAATSYNVEHEVHAWDVLAQHGLAVPGVVVAERGTDNPFGRPFLVTRRLPGTPFTDLLKEANNDEFGRLLYAVGDYLRRMHSITFAYPGYIAYDEPSGPLPEGGWQHPIWSAAATKLDALATLEADKSRLSPELVAELAERFAAMDTALAAAFDPPRFTHGDCHAHQFFIMPGAGGPQVSGVLDMEVASAGDAINDLLKLGIELAVELPTSTRWWEPLFDGYGSAPDFELFKLRLLGLHEANFKCHGADKWHADREESQRRLLASRDWRELFTT